MLLQMWTVNHTACVGKLGKVGGSKVSMLSTLMLGEGGLKCLVVVKFPWPHQMCRKCLWPTLKLVKYFGSPFCEVVP